MKFVVLGECGTVGTDIAKDLTWEGSEGIEKVIIADFNVEKAKHLARELGDSRGRGIPLGVWLPKSAWILLNSLNN
ncbi:MAG: hypothetical protein J7L19_01525 [Dehalococcoidia bacterium]|nr:hypothetical protein [Dehalococcoidia bacterium]